MKHRWGIALGTVALLAVCWLTRYRYEVFATRIYRINRWTGRVDTAGQHRDGSFVGDWSRVRSQEEVEEYWRTHRIPTWEETTAVEPDPVSWGAVPVSGKTPKKRGTQVRDIFDDVAEAKAKTDEFGGILVTNQRPTAAEFLDAKP